MQICFILLRNSKGRILQVPIFYCVRYSFPKVYTCNINFANDNTNSSLKQKWKFPFKWPIMVEKRPDPSPDKKVSLASQKIWESKVFDPSPAHSLIQLRFQGSPVGQLPKAPASGGSSL